MAKNNKFSRDLKLKNEWQVEEAGQTSGATKKVLKEVNTKFIKLLWRPFSKLTIGHQSYKFI